MNMSGDGGVAFRGMRRLKVVKIRRFSAGGEESASFNFSPSMYGIAEKFFKIPDVAWRECGLHELNGAVRYVGSLREHGEKVEVSMLSDGGIICFDLLFNGESRSL